MGVGVSANIELSGQNTNQVEPIRYCHWVDIGAEEDWRASGVPLFPSFSPRFDPKVADCEQLALHWFDRRDLVVLRQQLDPRLLEYWHDKGQAIANYRAIGSDTPSFDIHTYPEIVELLIASGGRLLPYVPNTSAEQLAQDYQLDLLSGSVKNTIQANNKTAQHELLKQIGIPLPAGQVFTCAESCLDYLSNTDDTNLVLKSSFGASGKAVFRLNNKQKTDLVKHRLRAIIAKDDKMAPLLIERWYQTKQTVSYKLDLTKGTPAPPEFVKTQYVEDTVYRGFDYSFAHHSGFVDRLRPYTDKISSHLYKSGVGGMVNIDAIETTDGELFPAIDVNARFSLAMYIEKLVDDENYFRCLYFDTPIADIGPLLEATKPGGRYETITVLSISRPDNQGARRVFILLRGQDKAGIDNIYASFVESLSV